MNKVGKICRKTGCPGICFDKSGYCSKHAHLSQTFTKNLPRLSLYNTSRWKRLRLLVLKQRPICNECKRAPSKVVHHIKEARQHPDLAYNLDNLEALCSSCHNRESQKESMKGRTIE